MATGESIVPPATSPSRSSRQNSHRWIGVCTQAAYRPHRGVGKIECAVPTALAAS
jgi:hypothetical protein